jgi:MFS family permease
MMTVGAILGAIGALLLILAKSEAQILAFGSFMSLGSAAFAGGSWALLADVVPQNQSARYFGLANFSTAGSTAAAGLLGPLIDAFDRISPGQGYSLLFIISALAFMASMLPLGKELEKYWSERWKLSTR